MNSPKPPRDKCDHCRMPSTHLFEGGAFDSTGPIAGFVFCFCESCWTTFRDKMLAIGFRPIALKPERMS